MRVLLCIGNEPSADICIRTPLAAVAGLEVRGGSPSQINPADLAWAQVVVFMRNCKPISQRIARAAALLGRPTVYELDDNLLGPPSVGLARHALAEATMLLVRQGFAAQATRFHAYRPLIAEAAREFRTTTFQPPTYFDTRLVPEGVQSRPMPSGKIVVVGSGRTDLPGTAQFVVRMVTALLAARPDVRVLSWQPLAALCSHPRFHRLALLPRYADYIKALADIPATVGLAPLGRSDWEDAKSNAKYRDYAGVGLPGVYSPTPVYADSVTDGVTGLVVPNEPDQWVRAVGRLLDDPILWHRVRAGALADIRDRYPLSRSVAFWQDALRAAIEQPTRPAVPRRPASAALRVSPASGSFSSIVHRLVRGAGIDCSGVTVVRVRETRDLARATRHRSAGLVLDAVGATARVQEAVIRFALETPTGGAAHAVLGGGTRSDLLDELAGARSRFTARVLQPGQQRLFLCQPLAAGELVGRTHLAALGMAIRSAGARRNTR